MCAKRGAVAVQCEPLKIKWPGPMGPAETWQSQPLIVAYSLIVRTTLEVGRSLTVGSFASFRIASS
jgi:hypothetical protein